MTMLPLEVPPSQLPKDRLVYVIAHGWALPYPAWMLDDRANVLYTCDVIVVPDYTPGVGAKLPGCWYQNACNIVDVPMVELEAYALGCLYHLMREADWRHLFGVPVDRIEHPR